MIALDNANEVGGLLKISTLNNNEGVPPTPKRLLSKRELAAVLNVSERTIENWLAQKKIPRLRLSNRLTRFNLPRVEAALALYEVKEVGAQR
jgi:excisionase family DNA binding protein